MMILHHLGMSQSERIAWLLEELNLPYELIRYDRDPETKLAPPAYRALHPFGTAPVFDDGPVRLTESGAIIEYIVNVYCARKLMVEPGRPEYVEYLFWWHFANASLMPAAMGDATVQRLGGAGDPISQMSGNRLDRAYAMIENRLSVAPYFAGNDLTIADIVMLFPLTTMRRFVARDIKAHPNLIDYLRRIGDRPAYRSAMIRLEPHHEPYLS